MLSKGVSYCFKYQYQNCLSYFFPEMREADHEGQLLGGAQETCPRTNPETEGRSGQREGQTGERERRMDETEGEMDERERREGIGGPKVGSSEQSEVEREKNEVEKRGKKRLG